MRRQTVDPRIRAKVIATYGNRCWLGMPGCSITATEDDHIVPYSHGGRDTVANLRRACKHCNAMRQDRVLSGYGATLHAVIGPPRADFGMAMQSMLRRDSIVVSFDSLLRDLCPTQSKATDGLRLAAAMAWDGAARTLAKSSEPLDVWLVRSCHAPAAIPTCWPNGWHWTTMCTSSRHRPIPRSLSTSRRRSIGRRSSGTRCISHSRPWTPASPPDDNASPLSDSAATLRPLGRDGDPLF